MDNTIKILLIVGAYLLVNRYGIRVVNFYIQRKLPFETLRTIEKKLNEGEYSILQEIRAEWVLKYMETRGLYFRESEDE